MVTLNEPVAALFIRLPTLTDLKSAEKLDVTLPPPTPTVCTTFRVPIPPTPVWHRIDVSEAHDVRSHPDSPILLDTVNDVRPKLDPCKVTLAEPVAPRLVRRTLLTRLEDNDKPTEPLPSRTPPVTATLWLLLIPCPIKQRADVSDSHVVLSQADSPIRAIDVNEVSPTADPWTVTLADPVEPRFVCLETLITNKPTDKPSDTLPVRTPRVTSVRRLPAIPSAIWHTTPVSDLHNVLSLAVPPILPCSVYDTSPMLAPYTVTLRDPDPPTFDLRITLITLVSIDIVWDTLPARVPTLITTGRVLSIP